MPAYPEPRRTGAKLRSADPPVVMVHGFAQTGACLGPLVDHLAADHEVVLPDAPGHSTASAFAGLDCPAAADALVAACGPGVYLGYSMGGRLALHAALAHPDSVAALVLISATAGIDDPVARAARRADDEARAAHLEQIGVAAFVEEWLAMDMFAALPGWARFDEERAHNTVEGLAGSLRHAGTGSMTPLWARLGELRMPVLCIAGGDDAAYVTNAERMVAAINGPDGTTARIEVVPDVGHAAHLESPVAVALAVRAFLAGLSG